MNRFLRWFAGRLHDAGQWPLNLIRDFPQRSGRLAALLWRAAKTSQGAAGRATTAARMDNTASSFRRKSGQAANWLHQLVAAFFDLVGGPEIGQFLMRLGGQATPLTAAEMAAISSALGPRSLRFGEVRVVEGGLFDWVFRLNGNLAFAVWHSICLPRSGRHTRANLALVVHELTHVYQYERVGTRYLGEAIYWLVKTRRDCYQYGGPQGLATACIAGRHFRDFNREQQAMIIQDYYTRQQQGADVGAYLPFIAQARAGDL
jgi:hypothetical protein